MNDQKNSVTNPKSTTTKSTCETKVKSPTFLQTFDAKHPTRSLKRRRTLQRQQQRAKKKQKLDIKAASRPNIKILSQSFEQKSDSEIASPFIHSKNLLFAQKKLKHKKKILQTKFEEKTLSQARRETEIHRQNNDFIHSQEQKSTLKSKESKNKVPKNAKKISAPVPAFSNLVKSSTKTKQQTKKRGRPTKKHKSLFKILNPKHHKQLLKAKKTSEKRKYRKAKKRHIRILSQSENTEVQDNPHLATSVKIPSIQECSSMFSELGSRTHITIPPEEYENIDEKMSASSVRTSFTSEKRKKCTNFESVT